MSRIYSAVYRVDNVDRPHAYCNHENTKVDRAACRRKTRRGNGGELPPQPPRIPGKRGRSRRVGGPIDKPPLSRLAWDVYGHMRANRGQQPFTWLSVRSAFPGEPPGDVTEAMRALLQHGKIREAY